MAEPINLDTASADELQTLRNIGPISAVNIIAERDKGPITTWAKFRSLAAAVTFGDMVEWHNRQLVTSSIEIFQPANVNLEDERSLNMARLIDRTMHNQDKLSDKFDSQMGPLRDDVNTRIEEVTRSIHLNLGRINDLSRTFNEKFDSFKAELKDGLS
jgi:hypothetical protein